MLLRSIRTVEHLRRISAYSVSAYLTSPSLVSRALPRESALSSPISRFYYSNPHHRHTTTTSSPVSSRWRISIRHMSRRRNAAKGSAAYSSAVDLAMDSVVKIFTVSTSPSYFLPWQNKSQRESMGSGFVISGRRIITNAHVVADHSFVLVRKHGSPIKHRAKVEAIGHECDLAVLVIDSEVFWEGMNSLELGDIPLLREEVFVVGYPQGGDNISVTKGVVSRVEPTQYVHGATQLMAIQIDAAINPGNSGGPAIMGNKVAGVAFQNLAGGENIGYIIPTPVIKHFINGVEESGKYTGFCSMGVSCQPMENAQIRSIYQMSSEMTGVLISKINPLSDAHKILNKEDVILAFDGVPIGNDGTVPLRKKERITFDHMVSMKKPNETALVKVLREGKEHEFCITLRPLQPLVPVHQFDQLPSYYIFSGFVFVPLTQPYLHEYGEDWYNTCPRRLCERALRDLPEKSNQQLVIISQVLMDDINTGFERLAELQVKKVNGVEVDNLRHLCQLIENCDTSLSSQLYSNGGISLFPKNQSSPSKKHLNFSKPSRLQLISAVQFRPCIDIHKGKVKQIVGSTLSDLKEEDGSALVTNFESDKSAEEYAKMYKEDGLTGGHVIMLGADPLSQAAALGALHAYPGGLQVGGGINSENCLSYIEEGASHVIVTSYVFNNGKLDLERLKDLVKIVGKERLILDLSCRKKDGRYAIVTDRWQKFSDVLVDEKSMEFLGGFADEFLVHGVDVEGKKLGIDEELVALLGNYSPIPVTYAGGVTVMEDVERIKEAGKGRVDVTVGSALDIFGGNLPYKDVVAWHHKQAEPASTLH